MFQKTPPALPSFHGRYYILFGTETNSKCLAETETIGSSNPLGRALITMTRLHLHLSLHPNRVISRRMRRTLLIRSHSLKADLRTRPLRPDIRNRNIRHRFHSRVYLTLNNKVYLILHSKADHSHHLNFLHIKEPHILNSKALLTPSRPTLLHNNRFPILPSRTFMVNLERSPPLNKVIHNNKDRLILNKATHNRGSSPVQTCKQVEKLLRSMVRVPPQQFCLAQAQAGLTNVGSSITRCRSPAFSSLRLVRTAWRGVGSLRARIRSIRLPRCSNGLLLLIMHTPSSNL